MPAATSVLLEFLMNLLSNPAAAAAYNDDPEGTLSSAGLADLCSADVDAVTPIVLDQSPVINTGGGGVSGTVTGGGNGGVWNSSGHAGAGGSNDHAAAVQQLSHVVNNYSYTDHTYNMLDQSLHQDIWAEG